MGIVTVKVRIVSECLIRVDKEELKSHNYDVESAGEYVKTLYDNEEIDLNFEDIMETTCEIVSTPFGYEYDEVDFFKVCAFDAGKETLRRGKGIKYPIFGHVFYIEYDETDEVYRATEKDSGLLICKDVDLEGIEKYLGDHLHTIEEQLSSEKGINAIAKKNELINDFALRFASIIES